MVTNLLISMTKQKIVHMVRQTDKLTFKFNSDNITNYLVIRVRLIAFEINCRLLAFENNCSL